MNDVRRKVDLYILSLGLLFVFLIILTAKVPVCFGVECGFIGIYPLITTNSVPIVAATFLAYSIYAFFRFNFDLKGATDIPFQIKKIEGINYEHLTFLATYIVPLISFNFGSIRQLVVLVVLLTVMGAIYIRTDLFYQNPSLALLGFRIYRVNGSFKNGDREGIILICRERLKENQKVSYIKLDDRIYFVKGTV